MGLEVGGGVGGARGGGPIHTPYAYNGSHTEAAYPIKNSSGKEGLLDEGFRLISPFSPDKDVS